MVLLVPVVERLQSHELPHRLALAPVLLPPALVALGDLRRQAVRSVLLLGLPVVLRAGHRGGSLAQVGGTAGGKPHDLPLSPVDVQRHAPVHNRHQVLRDRAIPARVRALAVQLGRLVGFRKSVRDRNAVRLPARLVLWTQSGRAVGGERVAVQRLRRPGARVACRGVDVLPGELLRRLPRPGRPPLLEPVSPLELPGRLDDELNAVRSFVVDTSPADGLGKIPNHGPGHAGQVA